MALSTRFKESFKTALAMVLAYGIALSMDWEKPMWAAFAVAVISLATAGQSINKGALRMLGTLMAAVFSLILVSLFPQDRWWLFVGLSLFVGFCTYRMGGSQRAYLWNMAGAVSLLICMQSVPATGYAFDLVVIRSLETGLGILCYTLVTLLLWPVSTAGELDGAVRALLATQQQLYQGYLKLLEGDGATEDLNALRRQEMQQINGLNTALAGAQADTYEVWELRRQWGRFRADAEGLMTALERWRQGFDEVRELDLKALMPDFSSFTEELGVRFGQMERLLAGEMPPGAPPSLDLELNMEAVRRLSHFQKAALALIRAELRGLESLTGTLLATLADIKGLAMPMAPPADLPVPHPPFLFDLDRLAAAIRVMVGLWFSYLIWIYVEVPGGVGVVIFAGSLGMALATNPQVPMRLLFKPAAVAIAFASSLYIFIMPRLSGFIELGSLIFAVTFAICYLFYDPRQAIGRAAGLMFFGVIAGIANDQSYSFLTVANTTLMLVLALTILAFAAPIPTSPQPEQALLRLLRRFFRGCEYLASSLRWDPARPPSRLALRRKTYHARELTTLPPAIALWARYIDTQRLVGTTPDQLQALAAEIQALAYQMQEALEARALLPYEGIGHELYSEIDAWRTGLQEIFRSLSLDPDAADHAGFRARLDGKLARLEAHIEDALNKADTTGISPQVVENSYRLLGAHRSLSEAVIAFAQQVPAIDWPRLREAHF